MHWHFRALYKKTEKMKAKRSRHFPNKDSIDESARRRFFQPPEVPWRLKLSKIIFSKKLPQIIQGFERELLKFIWSWYFGMGGFTLPSNSHQKDVYLSTCLTKASSKSISGGNWHPKGYWNISDHSKHKTNCHNYKQRLFEKKMLYPISQSKNKWNTVEAMELHHHVSSVTNQPLSRHFTVRCPHWPSVVKFKQLTELEKQLNLQV